MGFIALKDLRVRFSIDVCVWICTYLSLLNISSLVTFSKSTYGQQEDGDVEMWDVRREKGDIASKSSCIPFITPSMRMRQTRHRDKPCAVVSMRELVLVDHFAVMICIYRVACRLIVEHILGRRVIVRNIRSHNKKTKKQKPSRTPRCAMHPLNIDR